MKKLMMACCALALAGCASVELSSVSINNGERVLAIQSKGYGLLRLCTLWTGNLTWNERKQEVKNTPVFFENHADAPHLYAMAQKIAARENCTLTDVAFINNYDGIDPKTFYGLIFSYDASISAVLRPNGASAKKGN